MSTIKFVVSVVAIELLRNPQIKRGIVSASYPFSRPPVSAWIVEVGLCN